MSVIPFGSSELKNKRRVERDAQMYLLRGMLVVEFGELLPNTMSHPRSTDTGLLALDDIGPFGVLFLYK